MPRDYYEILGVPRTASDEEIRKAHRRLARKLHPDVNKASDASARFGEAQEAYDILSDPEKRKRYDQFGHAGVNGAAAGSTGDPFGGAGPFRTGTSGRPGSGQWSPGDGGAWSDVDPETFDSIFGDLFGSRRGRPAGRGAARGAERPDRNHPPQVGDDVEHAITVPFAIAAHGGTEQLRMTASDGSQQTIDVKIPAGLRSGSKLRVKGKGQPGVRGAPAGDLILVITVGEHPWFRREGLDLYLDVPITIVEAALGVVLEVPLLRGTVKLRVPAGTSSGAKLRAKGKGLSDAKGESGDFYAVIRVVAPESLDETDRRALETIGEHLPNPRATTPWANEVSS